MVNTLKLDYNFILANYNQKFNMYTRTKNDFIF